VPHAARETGLQVVELLQALVETAPRMDTPETIAQLGQCLAFAF
jgi:hypothetical protein